MLYKYIVCMDMVGYGSWRYDNSDKFLNSPFLNLDFDREVSIYHLPIARGDISIRLHM